MWGIRLSLLAACALLGCGSSEGSTGSAGASASGGAPPGTGGGGANAGTSSAGASSGAASGGAAQGGSAPQAGSANAGASGGGGLPPNVFDPGLPEPSVDCRASGDTKRCVSIRGEIDGTTVDAHCTSQAIVNLVFDSPRAWVADCTEGDVPGSGRQYQVTIPVQQLGSFDYTLATAQPYAGVSLLVSLDDGGGSSLADHFTSAALRGAVEDGGLGAALVSGTFRASWGAPAAGCDGGAVDRCAAAAVNGTFRILHSVGPSQ